jgi:hypothetical protein
MNNSLIRISLHQPDQSKSASRIDLENNKSIRENLLDVFTDNEPGIPFKELNKPVDVNLSLKELADLDSVNVITVSEN